MLQRIPAWLGCMTGTWARQRWEQPLAQPLSGISPVPLRPLLLLSIFHFSFLRKSWGFPVASPAPVGINTPQQRHCGAKWLVMGSVAWGIRAAEGGIWDAVGDAAVAWGGRFLCKAWAPAQHGGSSSLPALPGIAPSSLGVCTPCTPSMWAPASPFPRGWPSPYSSCRQRGYGRCPPSCPGS